MTKVTSFLSLRSTPPEIQGSGKDSFRSRCRRLDQYGSRRRLLVFLEFVCIRVIRG